ncbi:CRISPR-associated helicase Cas3 [Peptostreptococcaceae bacterium oral taxon 113 str. W5053]|nr:CRISPR-associated helicase Cas3 [Peptostreptococcaceae bacterium oral taxon 113 str. W5053]
MEYVNDVFWAKKKEMNGQFFWLSLKQHLEDTKNIAGLLWEHWLCEGQRKLIEESLDDSSEDKGKKLAMFLGAIHDIGKATPAFQTKKGYEYSEELDFRLLENLERDGFSGIGSLHLTMPGYTPHNIAGQYLLMSYGVGKDIAVMIGGHHGKTVDVLAEIGEGIFSNTANYFQKEKKNHEIYRRWDREQRHIFKWALESCGFDSVEALPKIKQPAQVILLGLLIMADWIASNEDYFPLLSIERDERVNSSSRTEQGFSAWKRSDVWEAEYCSDIEELYKMKFGFAPRNVQKVMAKTIESIQNPGIIILEAPMGVGKTEAALAACEQLAYKTGRSGLFFGLPTQATSDGIFSRIVKWLPKIKEDQDEAVPVRLLHGKAYLNEEFTSLSRNINIDGEEDSCLIVNEWFSGRKTASLDDFVVGTVDQFLMVALRQKHLALRHLGYSKKVVIIDEVHAYDAYMNRYLLQAVKWVGTYGVPVIILSATLPENRRLELMKNYMSGMGIKWNKKERKERDNSIRTDAYPLITYNDGKQIHQIREFMIQDKERQEIRIQGLLEENLEEKVEDMLSGGGIIGIMVNTVKRAQSIAKLLSQKFGDEVVDVLHSSFIATERVEKEKALIAMIGKGAHRPYQKIIIGTQVIEQSLDIDFDVLISDLAPMDLLLQRMGRLHRHDETKRPDKHKSPVLYIMGMNDTLEFEEGSSFVYGDFLLARTQYYLPKVIRMPEDISVLVQKVYGFTLEEKDGRVLMDNDIQFSDSLSEKYLEFLENYCSKIKMKEKKANDYRIEDPVLEETIAHEENLIAWTKNPDLDNESKSYAQVRDIEDSVEVIALKRIGDGYGTFTEGVDISGSIGDNKTARKVARNTLILPKNLTKIYNIDETIKALENYNRENLSDWRNTMWLKEALGIIFDEKNEFVMDNFKLLYDKKYGVSIERV